MTSRLHMDAEIEKLRRQIEDMPDRETPTETDADLRTDTSALPDAEPSVQETSGDAAEGLADTFHHALAELGIDPDEIEDLWAKLRGELEHLSQNQPLLTTAGAFAVGFVLGRMSKR